jgi:predicted dithiol-disulfide oxidoreductase (DUF899 family)
MKPARLQTESAAYAQKRDELLAGEIALRTQIEQVAALRRQLPLEDIDDYVLREGPLDLTADGPLRDVRLSQLFDDPAKPLVIEHYMFGGAQKQPCPMCTLWIDGYSGITRHLRQVMNFAVVAEAPIEEFRAWGRERGWQGLRLMSSAGSGFKTAMQFQDAAGNQWPSVSVFVRADDGAVKHFYSNCALMTPDINRGMDLLSPLWNLLDLTPAGRGDFNARLDY